MLDKPSFKTFSHVGLLTVATQCDAMNAGLDAAQLGYQLAPVAVRQTQAVANDQIKTARASPNPGSAGNAPGDAYAMAFQP